MEAKVAGFVPGVDMVDGKCDVAAAHYFLQVFADGDVYTVRRTGVAFFELEAALLRRFPKLGLTPMPLNECEGAAAYQKQAAKKKRNKGASSQTAALLSVDDLSDSQPRLTDWLTSLVSMPPVLASDEMRSFITDEVVTGSSLGSADAQAVHDGGAGAAASSGGSEYDRKRGEAFARFSEDGLENILLEREPVEKTKVQPGGTHTITLTVRDGGSGGGSGGGGGDDDGGGGDGYICWAFTTLVGKTNPAKDVAFSMSFTDAAGASTTARPYERHSHAATQLIKGCWQCPGPGVATLTWHNDYSKWYAKHVAYKAVVVTSYQRSEAVKRQRRRASAMLDREDQRNALDRVMQGLGGGSAHSATSSEHGGTDDGGDLADDAGSSGAFGEDGAARAAGGAGGADEEDGGVCDDVLQASRHHAPVNFTGGGGGGSGGSGAGHSKSQSAAELATLRRENETLKGGLAELSQENTNQREQIERLTSDALKSAAALNVDDAEKRLVALGQQLNQVKSELAAEQRAHQHSRDLLMTLQQRWQEKVDQLAHFEQQHAATEAQAQKLKEEKKILKAVAKQYKEEAERQGHDLIMLRNHVAFAKEKEAAAVAAAETAAAAAAVEAAISSPPRAEQPEPPPQPPQPPAAHPTAAAAAATHASPPQRDGPSNNSSPPLLSVLSPAPQSSSSNEPAAASPPTAAAAATAAGRSPASNGEGSAVDVEASVRLWAGRVQVFYEKYCPAKAAPESCESTARKFHGRESDLFTALYHKYSVPEDEQAW